MRHGTVAAAVAIAVAGLQVLPVMAQAASVPSTSTVSSSTVAASTNLLQQLELFQSQINSVTQSQASQSVSGTVYGTGPIVPQPTYPQAPADFSAYLSSLVASMTTLVQAVPMAEGPSTLSSLSQFGSALNGLSQSTLNQLYFYLSQGDGWQQYPTMLQSAVAQLRSSVPDLNGQFAAWVKSYAPQFTPFLPAAGGTGTSTGAPAEGSGTISSSTTTGSLSGSTASTGGTSFSGTGGDLTTGAPATADSTASASDAFPPIPPDTCPPVIPYPGMIVLAHGLDLVEAGLTKGAKLAERDDTWGAVVLGEGVEITIPGIIHDILEVAAFVVQAVQLGDSILSELHSECETEAHAELLKTLYENLSRTQGQVIFNTDTIITDVIALTTIVNARTSTILQNIGDLRAQINNQVSTILNSQGALITAVNGQTLQNEQNQQAQVAVNARTRQVQIENDLSQPLEENNTLFELPSSVGGYLNATPVGVKSVVTGLVVALQQSGQEVAPQALLAVSLADRALTMKQYKLGYTLYKIGYQILQYVGPFSGPPGRFGLPNGPYPDWPFGPFPAGG